MHAHRTRRFFIGIVMMLLVIGATAAAISIVPPVSSSSSSRAPASVDVRPVALPGLAETDAADFDGLHNVVAFHEGFLSGSVPEGDAGFDTLAAMGVRTIISVDGAIPEVDAAKARGLRYIHLPIGYNGFDEARKLELTRAVRDALAAGPVYLHCHHGKHRSAGAAGAVAVSLGWLTPDEGLARMHVSGTAPNYTGLFACTAEATLLDPAVIDAVPADFPEISRPGSFVQSMVEMDEVNDHLRAVERAGWTAPADHPDLVPVAEAGRLVDLYRFIEQAEESRAQPEAFKTLIVRARDEAKALEDLLTEPAPDHAALRAQMQRIQASCKECHAAYRD